TVTGRATDTVIVTGQAVGRNRGSLASTRRAVPHLEKWHTILKIRVLRKFWRDPISQLREFQQFYWHLNTISFHVVWIRRRPKPNSVCLRTQGTYNRLSAIQLIMNWTSRYQHMERRLQI
ncbi:hypothetical protein AB0M86_48925, partial [Streptomyces sp. NPDC051639]|uniref:hypothetical protein n=1 Tax=Streptomyces sp. NPDC051639 TaxID=3155671 RepID=UPI00342C86D1